MESEPESIEPDELPELHQQYIDSDSEDELQGKHHQVLKVSHDGTLMGVGDSPIIIHGHHNVSIDSPQLEEEEESSTSGRRSTSVSAGGNVVEMEEIDGENVEESQNDKPYSKAKFSVGSIEEEDEETDREVAQVLALEEISTVTSKGFHVSQPISQAQRTPAQDTREILHTEEDEVLWIYLPLFPSFVWCSIM